ncbi:hypothetical protein EDD18DRAFT_1067201, partial [Armillaria luteobubalina]
NVNNTFMSTSITVSYDLNPPEEVDAPTLVESKHATFNLKKTPADGHKAYYAALKDAIQLARNQVGDELTAWRDAVGKAELNKETTKTLKEEEEGEEEGEEE